jgi:hypothetical protein
VGPGIFRKLPGPGQRPQGVSVLLSSLIFLEGWDSWDSWD